MASFFHQKKAVYMEQNLSMNIFQLWRTGELDENFRIEPLNYWAFIQCANRTLCLPSVCQNTAGKERGLGV